ncbi:microtubule-associated protein 10 [Ambystoma mexicanum]|uniref:microtubule-associated protein 10 n=1 Tax=Ambystoma mexicanum TaxID=8296 RepID=UPI0037E959C3
MSASECLFSLELLVDWVRLEPLLELAEPPMPAMAFRLLDFPTLLIYPPTAKEGDLPSSGLFFRFGRGKSCLFRKGPHALLGHLSRCPLYAMLLDLRGESTAEALPRLLGSCPLSLAAAARDLLGEPQELISPGASTHRGVHAVHDLLGGLVGEISIGFRLVRLGGGLLRHIAPTQPQDMSRGLIQLAEPGSAGAQTSHQEPQSAREKQTDVEMPVVRAPVVSVGLQTSPATNNDSDPGPSTEAPRARHTSLVSTQTEEKGGSPAALDREELEIEANIFCPPPMYYSHEHRVAPSAPRPRWEELQHSMPQNELFSKERDLVKVVREHPTAEPEKEDPAQRAPGVAGNLRQLPLLSALLLELSLLNPDSAGLQNQHQCVHPQLAWLYRPTDQDSAVAPTLQDRSGMRSPSPKLPKTNISDIPVAPVTPPSSPSKPLRSKAPTRGAAQEKRNVLPTLGHPKKKLLYGLTNTLRLRLQQSNPDMLILHERREKLRKQQVEAQKEKKGKPQSRGILSKSPRSPQQRRRSHARRSRRGACSTSFDENIETLIQSNRVDDHDGNMKDGNQPYSQNMCKVEHILKDHNEINGRSDIFKTDHRFNSHGSKDTIYSVPLPRPLVQEVDIVQDEGVLQNKNEDYKSFNAGDPQHGSRNSAEWKDSEDFIDSLEYTGYSDDFTSPDHTARHSEALDSSPELVLDTPKPQYSDHDSDSCSSTKPGLSLKTSNTAAPIPVISKVSPVQSYKRAVDLVKSHGLVTAMEVTNSDFSLPPETSLAHQQRPQDTRVKGNSILGNITHLQKNTFGTGDNRNTENGHHFLETSQSVRTSQVSSYMPSTVPDLDAMDSAHSEPSQKEELDQEAGTSDISKQYRPMTELLINKLPGYTL